MTVDTSEPHVDVLGPVTVRGSGGVVALTRSMEIGVLGLLALHAGSPVSSGSLIDLLWPDEPPRTAGKTLQGYVKRVRGLLAVNGIELTHAGPAGYVLKLEPQQVDANRFESLVAHARTSEDDSLRRRRLDDALALWRGEPFAGCELEGVQPHREWLLRLHSGTRVERVAAQIRLGVTPDTIAAIRALLVDEPTNERLWLHLAGALYLFGNPVAALDAVTEARRQLVDRVGVGIGPELAELQRHMLDHDDVERCYYRLTGEEPPSATGRPGRARPATALPLPLWGGELIGRDDVLGQIAAAIDDGSPIITITGPAGMGKTRCAVEAARRAATPCDGFVDLSALTTGAELALHLAGCFGVPDRDDPVAAVAAQLKGSRVSVILDNVEQIQDAAAVLDELTGRCPSVVWLVTSQSELGIDAERVIRLRPLSHESPGPGASPATALLTAAAKRRGVTTTGGPALDRIAASIGGIPLALELAACQLQYLEPDALLRSLTDPIGALVDPRQPVGRHRSMRACFELGLGRLGGDTADLLALVSHRPNGCRYDDLADWWPRTTPFPRAVAELVEVGFADLGPDQSGASRLSQQPVVRAFGRTLPRPADADLADTALDQAILGRAQASMTATRTSVLEPDLPDIRRLLQLGVDDPRATPGALQLAVLLTVYWWSARITEGRRWLDTLLAADDDQDSPIRPYALNTVAFLDFYVGDAESARHKLDDALQRNPADPVAHARLLALRAMLDAAEGSHDLAAEHAEHAIELARAAGDDQSLWFALGNAGDVATASGRGDTARGHYLECIERLRRTGLDWLSAAPHARLGDLEVSAGEHRRARMWFERSISLWSSRELGPGAPQTLAALGRLDALEGDQEGARRNLDTALATAERCGSRGEYPWIALGYAALMAACGRRDEAAVLFGLGLRHGPRAGHCVGRLVGAELAPMFRWAVDDPETAVRDPLVTATRLEDLPMVMTKIVTS